jgi:hypothetical protein
VALLGHPETRPPVLWVPRALPAPRVLKVLRDHPAHRALRVLRALLASALARLLPLPELLK